MIDDMPTVRDGMVAGLIYGFGGGVLVGAAIGSQGRIAFWIMMTIGFVWFTIGVVLGKAVLKVDERDDDND